MLLWIVAKAKLHKIMALFYTFLITICVRWGTIYFEDTPTSERIVPENAPAADVYSWTMPDSMRDTLGRELIGLKWETKDSIASTKEFIEQAKTVLSKHLAGSELLEEMLIDLASETGSTDAVMLHNLPMDPYIPSTPTDGTVSLHKPTYVAEAILLAIGELAGTHVIGYRSEKEYSNPWVHEGFPRKGKGSALTAPDGVPHHQDMSYQNVIPDLLGLICLREGQDTQVQTTILDTTVVADHLPSSIVSTLRQRRFRIAAPSQWADTKGVDLSSLRPILEGRSLHLPVDWKNMVGADEEASKALDSLKQALQEVEPVGVHLVDGMMVIFNNQKVVHSRTPYKTLKFDGTDRVVYRSYFAKNLGEVEQQTRMI